MLYIKIQPQSFLGSEEEDFCFTMYGHGAILFNGAEPFEQIVITLWTEGPMWNLLKIAQSDSEKKPFINNTILHMYVAQGQGLITPGDQSLIATKTFYFLNHT